MTRRSFFSKFAGLVAAVALAPEIAFGTKLQTLPTFWTQTVRETQLVNAEYLKRLERFVVNYSAPVNLAKERKRFMSEFVPKEPYTPKELRCDSNG